MKIDVFLSKEKVVGDNKQNVGNFLLRWPYGVRVIKEVIKETERFSAVFTSNRVPHG